MCCNFQGRWLVTRKNCEMGTRPAIFKWRQTEPGLILCAVRWYLRYSLSLRDVEELLEELCSAKTSAGRNLHDYWCRFRLFLWVSQRKANARNNRGEQKANTLQLAINWAVAKFQPDADVPKANDQVRRCDSSARWRTQDSLGHSRQ